MDRTAIDYLVSFPTIILGIGAVPHHEVPTDLVGAHNRLRVEDMIRWDRRIVGDADDADVRPLTGDRAALRR